MEQAFTAALSTTGFANTAPLSLEQLYQLAYSELRQIARRECRRLRNVDTINSTALVNEAYLKLARSSPLMAKSRSHFLAVSAVAMRQILVNYLEQKLAQKRGGDWQQVTMADITYAGATNLEQLLSVNKALEELRAFDSRLAELVEMRFFAGMSEVEIAEVLECTERTVRRNWIKAKVLLSQIMSPQHV